MTGATFVFLPLPISGTVGDRRHGLRSYDVVLEFLEFAESDGLRHAVFGDDEVLAGEPLDQVAVLVLDDDVLDHQLT